MVRPNKHALAHAVDSWHLCQKQYQFFLRLYVFLFFFLFFLSFFFFPLSTTTLTLIARLEQWARLLSKVILSTTGKTIPRYDISATIHPFRFHRVATLRLSSLSLSLQSRRENCVEWLGCVSSFFLLPTVFPSAARRFTVPFTS